MKLTLSQFFKRLENLPVYDDLIVEVHYKYKHETQYTVSNELLLYEGDHNEWVWNNDWDEGQSDDPLGVFISAYIPVSEVNTWLEMINYNYKKALEESEREKIHARNFIIDVIEKSKGDD